MGFIRFAFLKLGKRQYTRYLSYLISVYIGICLKYWFNTSILFAFWYAYYGTLWNSPLRVVHSLGYIYPYYRRTYEWVANERNWKI